MRVHFHRPHLTHQQALTLVMAVVTFLLLGEGLVVLHFWSRRDQLEVAAILLSWSKDAFLVLRESLIVAAAEM